MPTNVCKVFAAGMSTVWKLGSGLFGRCTACGVSWNIQLLEVRTRVINMHTQVEWVY